MPHYDQHQRRENRWLPRLHQEPTTFVTNRRLPPVKCQNEFNRSGVCYAFNSSSSVLAVVLHAEMSDLPSASQPSECILELGLLYE